MPDGVGGLDIYASNCRHLVTVTLKVTKRANSLLPYKSTSRLGGLGRLGLGRGGLWNYFGINHGARIIRLQSLPE